MPTCNSESESVPKAHVTLSSPYRYAINSIVVVSGYTINTTVVSH